MGNKKLFVLVCSFFLMIHVSAKAQISQSQVSLAPSTNETSAPDKATLDSFMAFKSDLLKSVVKIQQNQALCAGVVLSKQYIGTAWHCVSTLRQVWVSSKGNSSGWPARVVAANPEEDIALLEWADSKNFGAVEGLSLEQWNFETVSHELKSGEKVVAVGHPKSAEYQVIEGLVLLADKKYITTTTRLYGGNSGGPLFDSKGRLVGIASKRIDLSSDRYFGDFVNATQLKALFQDVTKAKKDGTYQPTSWTEASGTPFFRLGISQSLALNDFNKNRSYQAFLQLGYNFYDRLTFSYTHGVLRTERFSAWEVAPRFELGGSLFFSPSLQYEIFIMRNKEIFEGFVFGPHFEIFGLHLGAFRSLDKKKREILYSISF